MQKRTKCRPKSDRTLNYNFHIMMPWWFYCIQGVLVVILYELLRRLLGKFIKRDFLLRLTTFVLTIVISIGVLLILFPEPKNQ